MSAFDPKRTLSKSAVERDLRHNSQPSSCLQTEAKDELMKSSLLIAAMALAFALMAGQTKRFSCLAGRKPQ
jgi:hypothetical protein